MQQLLTFTSIVVFISCPINDTTFLTFFQTSTSCPSYRYLCAQPYDCLVEGAVTDWHMGDNGSGGFKGGQMGATAPPSRIYVDSKLNFSKHLQNLVKKISQRISALRRQAKSLPLIHVKRLAEAVISPYLSYCSSAWFSALSATQIKQLQRQQNIIIRMVLGLDCHERITDFHLAKLNWLYVKEQLVFNQLKLIFKLRQQGPEATIVLPVIDNNHQMTTRAKSRADFQVERVTTEEQKHFSNHL